MSCNGRADEVLEGLEFLGGTEERTGVPPRLEKGTCLRAVWRPLRLEGPGVEFLWFEFLGLFLLLSITITLELELRPLV